MQTLLYATAAELREVDQDLLAKLTMDDPAFDLFPPNQTRNHLVIWEQRDNYRGLTQIRGLNGEPPQVPTTGFNRYMMQPSVFGEYDLIDEQEITTRAVPGTFNLPIDLTDIVRERQDKLMTRQVNRLRWMIWSFVVNGEYIIVGRDGSVLGRDAYVPQRFTSTVPWGTVATATPLGDLRNVALLHRGHSVNFGAGTTLYMNQVTFNAMASNTNTADLFGRRSQGFQTVEGLAGINKLLAQDNLPDIVIYDDGYLSDGTDGNVVGSFQLYIPNYTVVVIGKRMNGASVGEFMYTRNATNPDGGSQPYVDVIDSASLGNRPPRRVEVHRGFSGGLAIYFASSIVVMYVGP